LKHHSVTAINDMKAVHKIQKNCSACHWKMEISFYSDKFKHGQIL